MKKIFALLMAVMMLCLAMLAVVPAGAAEATEVKAGPLVITEIHNNPAAYYEGISRDYTEYMEVMNVGDTAIDLYDYKFYYTTAGSVKECGLPTADSKWNVFATKPGENILEPGEIAVIWFITSESILPHDDASKPIPSAVEYYRKEITEAEIPNYEVTYTDYQGKVYAYNLAEFKSFMKASLADKGWTLDAAFDTANIIVWDINIDFEQPTQEAIDAGKVGSSIHFNMANCSSTKAVKYWVTEKSVDVNSIDENTEFVCTAGVESGAGWSGQTFHYTFNYGTTDMIYSFDVPFLTPGYLYTLQQGDLVNLRHELNPQKYTETVEVVTTTEKVENVTTTEEETNPPKQPEVTTTKTEATTTAKPETTTNAPDNTTAAETTGGGCGGFTAVAQLFAIVVAAATFVVIKKKA